MAQGKIDQNRNVTLLGTSDVDGEDPTNVGADPTTKELLVKASIGADNSAATSTNGAPVTVGTTAVELTFTGTTKVISIQSDHDNTGAIWFGASNVDNTGANALGRLAAGQAVKMTLDDASSAIYAVSDTAAQKVYKQALT